VINRRDSRVDYHDATSRAINKERQKECADQWKTPGLTHKLTGEANICSNAREDNHRAEALAHRI
jgi:hypothetical protein